MGTNPQLAANAIPTYDAVAALGITPVTGGGLVPGLVARATPGRAFYARAALAAAQPAGWLVGYNAVAVPSDGAVNPALVLEVSPIAAGPSYAELGAGPPVNYSVGIVYYLTKGADPYAAKDTSSTYKGFIAASVLPPHS